MFSIQYSVLFRRLMMVAIGAWLLCIYQLIPNIYHIPVPLYAHPFNVHYKYAETFAVIAFLCLIVALIVRARAIAEVSLQHTIAQEQIDQD